MLEERIRELRLSFHLNQVELGKQLGVTKQCICNWENGNILPSIEMLIRLASFFHVTTDYLLGLENDKRIDVSGLTEDETAHIRLLIDDLKNRDKK